MPASSGTETLTLDPTASPVELAAGAFLLRAFSSPTPTRKRIEATSQETEGALQVASQYDNRTVSIVIRAVKESTRAAWYAKLQKLEMKVAKINAEGGVLRRVLIGSATPVFYDLVDVSGDIDWDGVRYALLMDQDVTLNFLALPFVRGSEIALTDHVETTLPVLVFTDTGVKGDVPGIGRLVIDDDQASPADQLWVTWGLQSRRYDSATSAALFYQAEEVTFTQKLNGATNAAVGTASGGNAVQSGLLGTDYSGIFRFQGTHVGTFRIYARVSPSTIAGVVSLALRWAPSTVQFPFVENQAVTALTDNPSLLDWSLADFGIVRLPPPAPGQATPIWNATLVAKSTVPTDKIYVDCWFLVPVDENSGRVNSPPPYSVIDSYWNLDTFDQVAGALNAKVPTIGAGIASNNSWTTSGVTGDFQVSGTGQVTRASATDAGFRIGILPVALTDVLAQVDLSIDALAVANNWQQGLMLRYVDASNYLYVQLNWNLRTGAEIAIRTQITASFSSLGVVPISNFTAGVTYRLRAQADAKGRVAVWFGPVGSQPDLVLLATSTAVATGGALASGTSGIFGAWSSGVSNTMRFDNFASAVPQAFDASIYSTRSMQVTDTGVSRQDPAGTTWILEPGDFEGDLMRVPPAGVEGRTLRGIVKASRMPLEYSDSGIDDISARLFYTPRWLQAPDS